MKGDIAALSQKAIGLYLIHDPTRDVLICNLGTDDERVDVADIWCVFGMGVLGLFTKAYNPIY